MTFAIQDFLAELADALDNAKSRSLRPQATWSVDSAAEGGEYLRCGSVLLSFRQQLQLETYWTRSSDPEIVRRRHWRIRLTQKTGDWL